MTKKTLGENKLLFEGKLTKPARKFTPIQRRHPEKKLSLRERM